jgi:hypothetical protein
MTDPEPQEQHWPEASPTIPLVPDAGYGHQSAPWSEPTVVDPLGAGPGPIAAPQPYPRTAGGYGQQGTTWSEPTAVDPAAAWSPEPGPAPQPYPQPTTGYGQQRTPWSEPTTVDPFGGAGRPAPGPAPQPYPQPAPGGYTNPVLSPAPTSAPQGLPWAEPGAPQRFEQPAVQPGRGYEPDGPAASLPAVFPGASSSLPYPQLLSYQQSLPDHPYAVVTLVLGVLGFVAGFTAPIAWILGATATGQVRRDPGRWRSGGMLKVGMVLGIIVTVGWALVIAMVVLGIVLFASA